QVIASLTDMPVTDAYSQVSLYEKRLLLHAMGRHPSPEAIEFSKVRDFARNLSLVAPVTAIEELCLLIDSCTAFGMRHLKLESSDSWIAELLSGVAMSLFRKYDLIIGCRILRTLCHLCVGGKVSESFLDFLVFHQRPEGPFGFFGTEEYELVTTMRQEFSAAMD